MRTRITIVIATCALALTSFVAAPAPAGAAKDPFPVTVGTSNGKVRIDERPTRIVSLSATATEMLFAIGAGKQVVAVDDQSDYPKGVPKTDLSGYTPNAEAIAGYKPDLVVASDNTVTDALKNLDITVLVEPAVNRLADAYDQIGQLGEATGHTAKAEALERRIKSLIADLHAKIRDRSSRPTAYYELDDTYFSASSKTFIGQVLGLAGLKNIADKVKDENNDGYPQLTAEYIVGANPDYIFLADTKCCQQSRKTVAARPGWSRITAVRKKHVVALDDDIASRWGPRVVTLLRQVIDAKK